MVKTEMSNQAIYKTKKEKKRKVDKNNDEGVC